MDNVNSALKANGKSNGIWHSYSKDYVHSTLLSLLRLIIWYDLNIQDPDIWTFLPKMGSHLVQTWTGLDPDWTSSEQGSGLGSTICLSLGSGSVQVHGFFAWTGLALDHRNVNYCFCHIIVIVVHNVHDISLNKSNKNNKFFVCIQIIGIHTYIELNNVLCLLICSQWKYIKIFYKNVFIILLVFLLVSLILNSTQNA